MYKLQVQQFNVTDCFTANYDVYKIVISDWSTDGSGEFWTSEAY